MAKASEAYVRAGEREVRISSPERVIYEATDRTPAVTKLMVAEYVTSVEDGLMRALRDRPTTLLLLDELTPRSFGALLAMYEHSVYLQSVCWGINAFDQWGVELGKRLATQLLPALGDEDGVECAVEDPVTRELLREIRSHR